MAEVKLETPVSEEEIRELQAGDKVLLSGVVYTARDAAHKRLVDTLDQGAKLPFSLEGSAIYYVGPAPAKPDEVIGSAGPTTSYRMDPFTPKLLAQGLKIMIGKGKRNQEVIDSMEQEGAIYLGATGGAAALISECITEVEVIAYSDLGTEAVRKLKVKDWPLICVIDSNRGNLYK
ncbi:hydro-lyase family enzyme, Fe-S type, tartrate/fumarate subfamily [Halobacteroides halobius DSM 5150]|uniref:Hydro-lyase family enzyme, Fe-S type, tartrate/fumarate subfamily n=1 Tax=Halobacteroides halobius (strain ATCC 35273 / DSM 5150 / MD-1) TaxID=748449 RepID=L0K9H1_HALHC|nr:Fe-S-containing hydro-lyase [Halobacteroides halobius]AGB41932.1 hydro-lyase family enzyme, Fe-S type, tartrate/fumarate subfamily [Halobacteroides halobius DSM 5150]